MKSLNPAFSHGFPHGFPHGNSAQRCNAVLEEARLGQDHRPGQGDPPGAHKVAVAVSAGAAMWGEDESSSWVNYNISPT